MDGTRLEAIVAPAGDAKLNLSLFLKRWHHHKINSGAICWRLIKISAFSFFQEMVHVHSVVPCVIKGSIFLFFSRDGTTIESTVVPSVGDLSKVQLSLFLK